VLASRFILSLIALASGAAAARLSATCCTSITSPHALATLGTGALAAVLMIAAVRANRELVRWLSTEAILIGLVLATVEIAVTATQPSAWTQNPTARHFLLRERAARKSGVDVDARSVSDVVASLRSRGIDALPGISRSWPTLAAVESHVPYGLFPLSHASNSTIVECNEGGQYLIYETDELGFNNPRGLVQTRRIDIAVVGESHALGYCVQPGHSTVDLIREEYPRTANFSLADTRSLSQLASFREYVEPLRPAVVLWFVNPGFAAPGAEADNPILARYLDESFSQGLIDRQGEVDALVRRLAIPIQEAGDRVTNAELKRARTERFDAVYKLPRIRTAFALSSTGQPQAPDLRSFEQVMRIVQVTTARWDGVLLVAVLPAYDEIVAGEAPEKRRRKAVMEILDRLDVRVIDGTSSFHAAPDPAGLFALRIANHPNAAGHALLARQIIGELRRIPQMALLISEDQ
jgi:hypothetical protein